jgi:glycine/D-amino acid oxidase-like deaminating enzyme
MNWIAEPRRRTPVIDRTQVLVVGGGVAGLSAAIAARKLGADVLLVERYGFLGGAGTAGLVGNFCGFFIQKRNGELLQIVQGFGEELLHRLRDLGAAGEPRIVFNRTATIPFETNTLRFLADQFVQKYGVRIYYHSQAVAASVGRDSLQTVVFEGKSGRYAVQADVFIDATGDGDLAAQAGADFETQADSQFPSTVFCLGNVDRRKARSVSREALEQHMERAVREGHALLPRTDGAVMFSPITGEVRCNLTRVTREGKSLDLLNTAELSFAEMEGRRQVFEYLRFLREHVPGYRKACITQLPTSIGIRETRRITGDYRVTENDVLTGRKWDDGIACGGWPLEVHSDGTKTKWVWPRKGMYYHFPLRALIVQGVSNLFAVGRCASTTHLAHASTRVMGSCITQGEAAGVVAALAVQRRATIRSVPAKDVQSALISLGAFLG